MTSRFSRAGRILLFGLLVVGSPPLRAGTPGDPVVLAAGGVPCLTICVGSGATDRVQAAAGELATQLERICGGPFTVVTGLREPGIVVGLPGDFHPQPEAPAFQPGDPWRREEYLLRTDGASLHLLGATETAVEHAVWDLLGRLGYRLYFLTDTWEIVPSLPDITVAFDEEVRPDYHTRLAPRQAPWSNAALWKRWLQRNRASSAFSLSTGHSYGGIIAANEAAFAAHPEYYAMVDNIRQTNGSKFCISNPGLRQLVTDYAVGVMQASPDRDSVSMEPSDGGGWCECGACADMGSVSDRVLWLANDVARAINALGLGPRYVGMYAYNEHSPPPAIAGHSNVIVNIATSFIRGGYSVEELVEGWRASGVTLGIRDYHDVFTWSHDLPRRARGGNLSYLSETIPFFYERRARFMNSESSDSWGANGLGYWLSPLMLWDVDQARRLDVWIDDFLNRAFETAAGPMRAFYELLNTDRSLQTDENVIARMYACLAEAYACGPSPAVRARLDDLVLYTRYVELYHHYRGASGEARQAGFEAVVRHAYRMRDRYMVLTQAIYYNDQFRDDAVSIPPEAVWGVKEPDNPWKDSTPYAAAEIAALVTNGMAAFPVDEPAFEPATFSRNLVPSTPLQPPALPAGSATLADRGTRRYCLWLDEPGSFTLDVRGGMITHYQDRGNVRITLSVWRDNAFTPVAFDASVPPDNTLHTVTLASPHAGLHALDISDGSDKTMIVQPDGLPLTYYTPIEAPEAIPGTWTLYVYVPPRTAVFGGFASTLTGRLRDGSGTVRLEFSQMERPGYFAVPVPTGGDGAFWKFESCTGHRIPMTVPPCLAKTPAELLLPAEVVHYTPPEPVWGDGASCSATGITQNAAWIGGLLLATGAAPATVTLYWGDGVSWIGQVDLGSIAPGPFQRRITGLTPGTAYVFRAFAWHPYGSAWSEPGWFTTLNTLPFAETFESRSTGPLHLQHGWISDPTGAAQVVQHALQTPAGTRFGTLQSGRTRQDFGAAAMSTHLIWTDLLLRPARSTAPADGLAPSVREPPPEGAGTAMFYVDYVTGVIMVYDGREVRALTETPPLAPGEWGRFTVRSDYTAKTWSLWLNGSLLARDLGFFDTTCESFSSLTLDEPATLASPTAFDNIRIALDWNGRPAGVVVIDDDGDGICDDWERGWFGSLTVAAAASDQDGDGSLDREEFLAGTDPLDPGSRLVISAIVPGAAGRLTMQWPSAPERIYALVAKTNLADAAWSPVQTRIAATAPTNTLSIPVSPAARSFFRIRLESAP